MATTQNGHSVSSISAARLEVMKILCDDYLFVIPNYQRPYSWEDSHCEQLLIDIEGFAFRSKKFDDLPPYFMGSAVVIKKQTETTAQVVDGQQRLTTLTILLSCLRHIITSKEDKAELSNFIYQKGSKLKGTEDSYRLLPRPRDREFFRDLIQHESGLKDYEKDSTAMKIDNDAQQQMLDNALHYLYLFREKRDYTEEQLMHLAQYIIQRCVLVVVSSTDDEMAFRIFNVLNDRGKDLSIADILKSEVIEKISQRNKTDEDAYTQKWENCETLLGIHNFKEFFSHLRAIYAKKKADKAVLDEIREYVNPTKNPKSFIDDVLVPFTEAYDWILNNSFQSTRHADDINALFSKLKRVSHTDWIPCAIYYIAKHPNAPADIFKFLQHLENVTLCMEGKGAIINDRLHRFGLINTTIEKGKDLYATGSALLLTDIDRKDVIAMLISSKIYGKRLLKPVLAKIEEEMNDASITIGYNHLSIEHVLPQKPTAAYWKTRFTLEDQLQLTNNLGNLSLVTVRKNSQASNYDFDKKVKVYFKADGKASNLAMVNNLGGKPEWTPKVIQSRNIELLNHFLKALGLAKYSPK